MTMGPRWMILTVCGLVVMGGCTKHKEGDLAEVVNMGDPGLEPQLLKGFHPIESGWRWTMGQFSVALKPPRRGDSVGAVLVLKYSLAEAVMEKLKEVTITAVVDGIPLPPEKCTKGGT